MKNKVPMGVLEESENKEILLLHCTRYITGSNLVLVPSCLEEIFWSSSDSAGECTNKI